MRTSLNDIKQTEEFLSGDLLPEDALLFNARLLVDPFLRLNTTLQKKTYFLIRLYARKKLRSEIELFHKKIFNDPEKKTFQQKLFQLFAK